MPGRFSPVAAPTGGVTSMTQGDLEFPGLGKQCGNVKRRYDKTSWALDRIKEWRNKAGDSRVPGREACRAVLRSPHRRRVHAGLVLPWPLAANGSCGCELGIATPYWI